MPRPSKFKQWPHDAAPVQTPEDLHRAYDSGWSGCLPDRTGAREKLAEHFRRVSGYTAFSGIPNLYGSGAGKLILLCRTVQSYWPNAYPGEAQQTGCCVSMGTKNAILGTLACELAAGNKVEGIPDVPPDGEATGVLSNAPIYWYRGYNGDGWSCQAAAHVAVTQAGACVCQPYPDIGIDVTHCNAHNDHVYGGQAPPANIAAVIGAHKLASAVELSSSDELRDALANGYGVNSCGGEGFSAKRNEDGVMERSGSWSHSMAYLGFDDRDVTKKKYAEPLVLVEQSWGHWGSGPRKILGTDLEIPEGFFWARWSAVKNRYMVAFSNLASWPPKPLKDWGTEGFLG